MSQPNITYNQNIITHAKARGADLSTEEIDTLNATLRSVSFVNDAGQIAFTLGNGRIGDLDAALSLYSEGMGRTSTPSTSTTQLPAGANATQRAIETNRAAREGSAALKRQQAEEIVRVYGSPWATSGNMTHAAVILNNHPELAERLRAEAGDRRHE
ncbi:hypothetical protein ACFZ8E_23415 [Methylobacterium sp. HMF5984]|uniref:hypothetical protein n=1 Tax=Methylobacterium sp. HMF5984 TaxID=3367370 RepID=UPI0038533E2A